MNRQNSMNRRERRHRRKEVESLSARCLKLRKDLLASDAVIENAQQRSDTITASTLSMIEAYVDSIARVVDIDNEQTTFAFQGDAELYEHLVRWKWRGVETAEQAKEMLVQEVARRSVGKTDIALLLSSIDHTAINLYATLPDNFKDLHGAALATACVDTLTREDFVSTLMADANWATMRKRWVRLGWRNTDDTEFDKEYIRVVVAKMVEIHDRLETSLTDVAMADTVIDELLDRVSPEKRAKMVEAFQVRLQKEYESLPTGGGRGNGYGEVLDTPRGKTEVGMLAKSQAATATLAMIKAANRMLESSRATFQDGALVATYISLKEGEEALVAFCGRPLTREVDQRRHGQRGVPWVTSYVMNAYVLTINGDPVNEMRVFEWFFDKQVDVGELTKMYGVGDKLFRILSEKDRNIVIPDRAITPEIQRVVGRPDPSRKDGWAPGEARIVDLELIYGFQSDPKPVGVGELVGEVVTGVEPHPMDPVEFTQRLRALDLAGITVNSPALREAIKSDVLADRKGNILPYSDHELMRRGRVTWEETYAKGDTDEQIRDKVLTFNFGSPFHDELQLFATKWAVHAFQRLITSHTFAAALMCSDVQRDVLVGIEKQWDAFLVIVPNKTLVAGPIEFSRVLVATYSYGARMLLLTTDTRGQYPTGLVDEASTLADLLVSDGTDLEAETTTQRCLILAKRLVAGLLLNLQHPPNFQIKKVEARPKSKKREAEPEHRIVTVGKPIEIDCRASVKEYIDHGRAGRKHGPPTVQVMVRGHYRRQAHGVGRMERKVIWIEPFWRGPEAALIQTRPTKAAP